MVRAEWLNLANALTVLRALLAPLLIWLLLGRRYEAALWIFFAAGLTDALDGFVARRFHQMTRVGALLDPVADKLVIVGSVLSLAQLGLLPLWLVLLIVGRDLVIVVGAVAFRLRVGHLEMAPLLSSKLNTVIQIGLILLVLLQAAGWLEASAWLPAMFAATAMMALASGAQYVAVWSAKAGNRG
jgi:cardiolipin synthase